MTVGVETCPPGLPITELARLFLDKGIEEIVVLDDGHAAGVIGHTEVLRAYTHPGSRSLTAQDIMREGVPQVYPEMPLETAAQIMLDQGVQSLFIIHHASGVEYPAAYLSFWHYLRLMAAQTNDDLNDLGIHAQRRSPLEIFIQKRDRARRRD